MCIVHVKTRSRRSHSPFIQLKNKFFPSFRLYISNQRANEFRNNNKQQQKNPHIAISTIEDIVQLIGSQVDTIFATYRKLLKEQNNKMPADQIQYSEKYFDMQFEYRWV